MKNLKKEVEYFIELVESNIKIVKENKPSKMSKEEMVFFNFAIKKDGSETTIYNSSKDVVYEFTTEEIKKHNFRCKYIKYLALRYIEKLNKFQKNEIKYKDILNLLKERKLVINDLLRENENIAVQLRALKSSKNIAEIQDYIKDIYNDKYSSRYLKYLIDKYFYSKKDIKRPEKNGLENMGKMTLKTKF